MLELGGGGGDVVVWMFVFGFYLVVVMWKLGRRIGFSM